MMNDEKPSCSRPPPDEPTATRATVPIWLLVLTLLLLFLGGYYFDHHSGWAESKLYAPYTSIEQLEAWQPKSGEATLRARGKTVYENVCGICHGSDGQGRAGQAPPLAASEWVTTKGFNRLAHIPLAGMIGPIQVSGKEWELSMTPMGATLSDDDLAAVLTYIRASWGNQASPVSAEDIQKIRAGLGNHVLPLTHSQLMQMEE